jgi:hypothetical protein
MYLASLRAYLPWGSVDFRALCVGSTRSCWLPCGITSWPHFEGCRDLLGPAVLRPLRIGFILSCLPSSSEFLRRTSRCSFQSSRPARVSSLFATSPGVSTLYGSLPSPATFRPQVFSTSRRFPPPSGFAGLFHPAATSRVFPFRGFSRAAAVPTRRRSVPPCRYLPRAHRQAGCHARLVRLRGFALRSDAFSQVRCLASPATRSPLRLSSSFRIRSPIAKLLPQPLRSWRFPSQSLLPPCGERTGHAGRLQRFVDGIAGAPVSGITHLLEVSNLPSGKPPDEVHCNRGPYRCLRTDPAISRSLGTAKGRALFALAASADGLRCTVPREEPLLGASLRSRASTRVPTLRALPVLEGPFPKSHRPLTSPVAPRGTIVQAPLPADRYGHRKLSRCRLATPPGFSASRPQTTLANAVCVTAGTR